MLMIVIAMLVILVICGLVVTYVAFPHRGEEIPGAPWLGDAMSKANESLPKLQDGDLDETQEQTRAQTQTGDRSRPEGFNKAS